MPSCRRWLQRSDPSRRSPDPDVWNCDPTKTPERRVKVWRGSERSDDPRGALGRPEGEPAQSPPPAPRTPGAPARAKSGGGQSL